ncbi:flagellar assembly protein FliH [Bacillus massiliglaciei]|uniref:flagellar assembly protein FliH n=1 Tax=Bacillus massiliglaciei TaxID=1816693 RepID=UPI000A4F5486
MSRIIKSYLANDTKQQGIPIKLRTFTPFLREGDTEGASNDGKPDSDWEEAARLEAEEILLKAHNEALRLKREIEEDRQRWENEEKPLLREQAQKEGFQQGYEDGQQKGYQEMAESIQFAGSIIESSKEDYQKHIEASEPVILELAVQVAGKIIASKLESEDETFLGIVKRAVKQVKEHTEVQLHIHPMHYPFVLDHKDELLAIFPRETELYIYPDEEMSETGCYIESDKGRIDASVDTQLEEIKQKLTELLEGE